MKHIHKIIGSFGLVLMMAFIIACTGNTPPPTPNQNGYIIFNTGTTEVMIETLQGLTGTVVTPPSNPTRVGYRFSHWELNGQVYQFSVFPSTTIVLNAVWNQQFTVSFDTGDNGALIEPIYFYEGDALVLPTPPNKIGLNHNGYIFLGWTYENMDMPFVNMPQMDIELVAKWFEALAISFEVSDSETVVDPIVSLANTAVTAPEIIPVRDGFMFTGWMYQGKPYVFDKMPTTSIQLEASWLDLSLPNNSTSALPKLFINLNNNTPLEQVNRENYLNSSITLTNTDEDFELAALSAEFKGRGNGSWSDSGPKKGYRIKFFKKQSFFGEAKSRHWVLLAGANFNDTTLMKNSMAFGLANDVLDGIEYSSSTYFVEFYVNGNYYGVYTLAEHVRVDKDRVNIESDFGVTDTGYLIEYDAYAAGVEGINYFRIDGFRYPFSVSSPDPEDYLSEGITEAQYRAQVAYIKAFTQQALTPAMNKDFNEFARWVDLDSFVDMYILHEFFKNTDTGYSSFFMYKKPGEDKLYAGPAWDFDASAGASRGDSSANGIYVADTVRQHSEHTASYLYINLMQTSGFVERVHQRWQTVSPLVKQYVQTRLSDDFINNYAFGMARNFRFWSPNYGSNPNQTVAESNWKNAAASLKNWLLSRANYLDIAWN